MGGRLSSSTISVFFNAAASSSSRPFHLRRKARAGNRASAPKCLEFGVLDYTHVTHLDLQLHYIAFGCTHHTGSNVLGPLSRLPYVLRIVVVL